MSVTRDTSAAQDRRSAERLARQVDRVLEFRAWVRAGCPSGGLRELPRTADFKAARSAAK